MNLIIGVLQTDVDTYNGRPRFDVYLQIWDMDGAGGLGCFFMDKSFEDVTYRQWQRFRRLQDALARLPAGEAA